MNLQDFINKLKILEDEVKKELPNWLDILAHDGLALIKKRLEEKGIEGAHYSDEYRDFKLKKQGADAVRVVNLRLTGRMLNNLAVIDRSVVGGTEYHAGIGNTNNDDFDKMESNIKRYKDDFLELTDQEKEILNATAAGLFEELINRIFK